MKWFKHMSDANRDDKFVSIRTKFGMWGIGVYWTLVEKAAEQMKGLIPVPIAILSMNETCSLCGCKPNKLKTFLKHLQNVRGMKYELNGDILKIEVKKLLQIKDNYHADLVETSKRLPSIEVEEDVEVEQKKSLRDKARPESLEEAVGYFVEIGSPGEAAGWWDHFTGNGWVTGKARAPVRDWKATARTWIRNAQKWGNNGKVNGIINRRDPRERETFTSATVDRILALNPEPPRGSGEGKSNK